MATTNAVDNVSCAICNKTEGLKRCGFCKSVFYCSREHQAKDWTKHKPECNRLKDEILNTSNHNPATEKSVNLTHGGGNIRISKDGEICDGVCLNSNAKASRPENIKSQVGDLGLTKNYSNSFYDVKQKTMTSNSSTNETDQTDTHLKNHVTLDKVDDKPRVGTDGIAFDTRPLKEQEEGFLRLEPNTDSNRIADIAVNNLNMHGFCVIDELFGKNHIRNALKDIDTCLKSNKFESGKLAGGRTSGEKDKQILNSDIRSDKIMWLEGNEKHVAGITTIVERMDEILIEFNKYLNKKYFINGRTKAMVACYPGDGSYYRRHVDNPRGDGRVVTCILYLNEDWNVKKDGGLLRIFPTQDADESDVTYIDVPPLANRLLFFWSDRRNPHEVQPAFRTRFAITVWYMDEAERKQAKLDSHMTEMAKIRGEYVLQERRKCQEERDMASRQLDDAACKAIAALTTEELKAMASIVAGQPNPEKIFAQMGIAPEIGTKLVDKLKQMES